MEYAQPGLQPGLPLSLNQKLAVMNKTFFLFNSNTYIITIPVGCTEYLELWERKTQAPPHACAVCSVTVTDTEK